MRSIGKANIRKLRSIIKYEIDRKEASSDPADVYERVMRSIPDEWLNIWEGAHSEIERIIQDTILELNR